MRGLSQNKIPPFEKIFSFADLFSSWQEFKKRKQKKKDVADFASNVIHNLSILGNDLISEAYKHSGYFYFKVSDPKPRDIHKASVRDRVVHHAIYRALYPYFDSKFIYDSYSCRVGKGTHRALRRFEDFIRKASLNNTKTIWVLKCDIKKCFASVDKNTLREILRKYILCPKIMNVIDLVINSFSSTEIKKGIPLGNLTSQLFINIYLNELDHFIKRELKAKQYIRYADDFVILGDDKIYLENLLLEISKFLEQKLKLLLHPNKVFVKTIFSGVDFLGWVHFPNHRVLRTNTKRRVIKVLMNNPPKPVLASYLGLLKHGSTHKLKTSLEQII
jgi:retron-type reverse transcriptase